MPRQTVSYLMKRFEESGIRPDSRRGQNFLIDLNLVELLARSAELSSRDVVLEVGTGTGSLTGMLAQAARHVITVEVDTRLYEMAQDTLASYSNITFLKQDVLRNKNNIAAGVLDVIQARLDEAPECAFKLVANLPYNVATPILSNLLRRPPIPDLMVVTIQKELADRIVAKPGSKDYGALSIWVQSQCEAEIIRVLPPTVFWPRPKVHSAIILVRPIPELRSRICDVEFFHETVRALFFHRRKYLRSVVLSAFKGKFGKPEVDDLLSRAGLSGELRAEQLSVEEVLRFCELAYSRLSYK